MPFLKRICCVILLLAASVGALADNTAGMTSAPAAYSGITLALDGFDILGNLSNISYVLNSQGRTETYRNSLPRYVMFHAIFHLNRPPEKQ